jgi:hypothetical protein
VANEADFNRRVLQAKGPVLVDFHKGGGRPPCKMVLPTLDLLVKKHQGKVSFYSHELITMWFEVTSERLKQQYGICYIPTVILFVDGKEVHRWPIIILVSEYEKVIDEVLAAREKRAPAEAKPAAKPLGGPAKVPAAPAAGAVKDVEHSGTGTRQEGRRRLAGSACGRGVFARPQPLGVEPRRPLLRGPKIAKASWNVRLCDHRTSDPLTGQPDVFSQVVTRFPQCLHSRRRTILPPQAGRV